MAKVLVLFPFPLDAAGVADRRKQLESCSDSARGDRDTTEETEMESHQRRCGVPNYVADDLSILPFTHEVKAGPYSSPRREKVRDSLSKLGVWERSFSTAGELISWMDAAGIEKALIPAQVAGTWEVSYDVVEELCREYSNRLYGMAGLEPEDIMQGVEKLEHAVRERRFVGAHSYPHWLALPPDDRAFYPFYAKCVELQVPVQIQVGLAFQTS